MYTSYRNASERACTYDVVWQYRGQTQGARKLAAVPHEQLSAAVNGAGHAVEHVTIVQRELDVTFAVVAGGTDVW